MLNKQRAAAAFSWTLTFLLAAFAVLPALLYRIEEYAYDAAMFHIHRSVLFSAARADGWLFPRWVQQLNAGLGSPIHTFYPPLVYHLMDLLQHAGVAQPLAWRLLVASALIAAAAGSFGLALTLFRRSDVALACAALVTYAPYSLQEFFGRGSPQGFAIALYPFVLWTLYRLGERPAGGRLAVAGGCWALLFLCHNLAALLLLPVIGVLLLFMGLRLGVRSLLPCLLALCLGSLLTAFYLLPALTERQHIQLDRVSEVGYTQPAANPLSLQGLLSLPPVFDTGLGNNSAGTTVGVLHALLLGLAPLLGIPLWHRKQRAEAVLVWGLAAMGMAMLWLQTDMATPVWAAVPALNVLQFRWRLLSTVGLLAAIIAGFLFERWPGRSRNVAVTCAIAVAIGMQVPSLYPELQWHRFNSFSPRPTVTEAQTYALESGFADLTTFGEFLPIWRSLPFTAEEAARVAAGPLANLPPGGTIIADERRTGWMEVEVETPVAFTAALHSLYFPGWAGYVDGQRQPIRPMEETGYTLLEVPAGRHTISLRYEGTAAQRLGDLSSGLALIGLLLATLLWRGQPGTLLPADIAYLQPRWWLPAALVLVIGLKVGWVDPHTTWLRRASTCAAIQGAQVQTSARFGEGLRLCGYSVSRRENHPGERLRVTLYWQSERPLERQAAVFVHLVGKVTNPMVGYPIWGQGDKQLPGGIQLVHWVPGKLYPDTYDFQVPAHTPEGDYRLAIGWWDPETGQRLPLTLLRPQEGLAVGEWEDLLLAGFTVRRSAWQRLGQWAQREVLTRRIQHRHEATLGGVVRFLGYDLERATVRPGEAVRLTLYWQTLGPVQGDYNVFTHLVDGQGQRWAGHDGVPVEGIRPTAGWAVGELLVDRREIVAPQGTPPGRYRLQVGLYDWQSGVRLPAHDVAGARLEEDRILLGAVTVE